MIFPILKADTIIQVGDQVRIDASKSFISPEEPVITMIEIKPSASDIFYNVTQKKFLDWVYSSDETKEITLKVTNLNGFSESTLLVESISSEDDRLFSNDDDLVSHESNIFELLPKGYSSFNHLHRNSQTLILDSLLQCGYYKMPSVPLTKIDIFNINEVKQWSKFLTLSNIYSTAMNEVGDFFSIKQQSYKELAEKAAQRAYITIDTNQDGKPDAQINLTSGRLVRR